MKMDITDLGLKYAGANCTPAEIAERLNISRITVYHYIETNELMAVNIGKGTKRPRWIISEDDAKSFCEMYERQRLADTETVKAEELLQEEAPKKSEKEVLLRKLYYIKEAMLDLTLRMEELERELEEKNF